MELPCCAIGGITAENCAPLVQAGADFLAVVGAVWSYPDGPAAGVPTLNPRLRRRGWGDVWRSRSIRGGSTYRNWHAASDRCTRWQSSC